MQTMLFLAVPLRQPGIYSGGLFPQRTSPFKSSSTHRLRVWTYAKVPMFYGNDTESFCNKGKALDAFWRCGRVVGSGQTSWMGAPHSSQWPTLEGTGYTNQNELWLYSSSAFLPIILGCCILRNTRKDVPSQWVDCYSPDWEPPTSSHLDSLGQRALYRPFSLVALGLLSKEPQCFPTLSMGQLQGHGDGTR